MADQNGPTDPAAELRRRRVALGLTTREAARLRGVSHSTVTHLENRRRASATRIADLLAMYDELDEARALLGGA